MEAPCLVETILFSCDFRAVDEPTHSAVDLFRRMHGEDGVMPSFVWGAFEAVKGTEVLNLKRALWLVLMRILPPIAEYSVAHARRREKAVALATWLETEVERLFTGGYQEHERPLDAFVEAAQIVYNTAV